MSLNRFRSRLSAKALRRRTARTPRRPKTGVRPTLERLEDRIVPATSPFDVSISGVPLSAPEGMPVTASGNVSNPAGVSYSWRAGRQDAGSALSFDGVDDFVVINRPVQDDFTLEAWINTTTSLSGSQFYQGNGLLYADVPFTANDFGASILNGKFAFGTGNPDVTIQSMTTVTTGQWVHVAAVRTRATGTIKVFVNGVEEASLNTGNTGPLSAPANIYIGANTNDHRYFRGQIDDVRIWNVARDAASIQADMNHTLTGNEPGLVGYYRFDEGSGGIAFDRSPSGNTGWIAPWWGPAPATWVTSTAPLGAATALATGNGANFTFTPDDNSSYLVSLRATGSRR